METSALAKSTKNSLTYHLCLYLLFDRGKDIESHEMLSQGFTHAFLMTFNGKEDLNAFQIHPNHIEFSKIFSPALQKIVVLGFI